MSWYKENSVSFSEPLSFFMAAVATLDPMDTPSAAYANLEPLITDVRKYYEILKDDHEALKNYILALNYFAEEPGSEEVKGMNFDAKLYHEMIAPIISSGKLDQALDLIKASKYNLKELVEYKDFQESLKIIASELSTSSAAVAIEAEEEEKSARTETKADTEITPTAGGATAAEAAAAAAVEESVPERKPTATSAASAAAATTDAEHLSTLTTDLASESAPLSPLQRALNLIDVLIASDAVNDTDIPTYIGELIALNSVIFRDFTSSKEERIKQLKKHLAENISTIDDYKLKLLFHYLIKSNRLYCEDIISLLKGCEDHKSDRFKLIAKLTNQYFEKTPIEYFSETPASSTATDFTIEDLELIVNSTLACFDYNLNEEQIKLCLISLLTKFKPQDDTFLSVRNLVFNLLISPKISDLDISIISRVDPNNNYNFLGLETVSSFISLTLIPLIKDYDTEKLKTTFTNFLPILKEHPHFAASFFNTIFEGIKLDDTGSNLSDQLITYLLSLSSYENERLDLIFSYLECTDKANMLKLIMSAGNDQTKITALKSKLIAFFGDDYLIELAQLEIKNCNEKRDYKPCFTRETLDLYFDGETSVAGKPSIKVLLIEQYRKSFPDFKFTPGQTAALINHNPRTLGEDFFAIIINEPSSFAKCKESFAPQAQVRILQKFYESNLPAEITLFTANHKTQKTTSLESLATEYNELLGDRLSRPIMSIYKNNGLYGSFAISGCIFTLSTTALAVHCASSLWIGSLHAAVASGSLSAADQAWVVESIQNIKNPFLSAVNDLFNQIGSDNLAAMISVSVAPFVIFALLSVLSGKTLSVLPQCHQVSSKIRNLNFNDYVVEPTAATVSTSIAIPETTAAVRTAT